MGFFQKCAAMMAVFTMMVAGSAMAGWKPDGPLTLQIGFGAGGSTDTMGRVLAKVMKDQTGWNIFAENKTGGGGVAMFTGIAKMPPNGKVIGLGVNMPILVNLVRRGDELPFDLDSFDYLGTIAKAELALVAAADASEEAPEDGQEPVMDADGQDDANEEAAMDDEPVATEDPFVMRAIVNIPEEPAKDEPPKSLIGHIAGLMFASKPAKADDSTESTAEDVAEAPHVAMPSSSDLTTHDAPRADHVEVMGVDMMGNALQLDATDIASEEMQAEAMQAEAGQETATIEPVSAEPKAEDAEMPMGGLASLKPTNQPKLDMNGVGEDVDLDIPAFLRRQAN